ncbi:MAG: hypothetical protein GC134_05420 [Proteobacteria bacterium]|nr:hypothetical protein [Pseudomonadota bacterium]
MTTVLLLLASNIFMTVAWYGHLKFKAAPLWAVILVSWGIALVEYCLAVPANRIGHGQFNLVQLKTIQEVITLLVFSVFAIVVFNEKISWNHLVGFGLLVLAVVFIFKDFR